MAQREFKSWYKLAFKLLVSPRWEQITERVENGDESYRWVKEQILAALGKIASENFGKRIGGAASDLRDRITSMKHTILGESDYLRVQHWMKRMSARFVLRDEDESLKNRLLAARLAMLEIAFVHYDNPATIGAEFGNAFERLCEIDEIYLALDEKNNPELVHKLQEIYNFVNEYANTAGIPLENLPEFDFPDNLPLPPEFHPPDIWVFGDFGTEPGQLYYPVKVMVDAEGNFLVLDQDVIGEDTVQKLQLFDHNGKFRKVILERGQGNVNGMADFCLGNDGNIIVIDSIDIDVREKGRVQIFDYDGNQVMERIIDMPDEYPRLRSCTLNEEGDIICFDLGRQCICVVTQAGVVRVEFGSWGRGTGQFFGNAHTICTFGGKIYACGELMTQVFDLNGTFLNKLDNNISAAHLVYNLQSSCFIGVADHKVFELDADGKELRSTGSFGSALEEFWFPSSVTVMSDGALAVADKENHRIKVFRF